MNLLSVKCASHKEVMHRQVQAAFRRHNTTANATLAFSPENILRNMSNLAAIDPAFGDNVHSARL